MTRDDAYDHWYRPGSDARPHPQPQGGEVFVDRQLFINRCAYYLKNGSTCLETGGWRLFLRDLVLVVRAAAIRGWVGFAWFATVQALLLAAGFLLGGCLKYLGSLFILS